jgi:hypothetical protein
VVVKVGEIPQAARTDWRSATTPHFVQNPASDQLSGFWRIALGKTALGEEAEEGYGRVAQAAEKRGAVTWVFSMGK